MKNISPMIATVAGAVGGVGGMLVGRYVHTLLPPGGVWFRAGMTGLAAASAGIVVSVLFILITSRLQK